MQPTPFLQKVAFVRNDLWILEPLVCHNHHFFTPHLHVVTVLLRGMVIEIQEKLYWIAYNLLQTYCFKVEQKMPGTPPNRLFSCCTQSTQNGRKLLLFHCALMSGWVGSYLLIWATRNTHTVQVICSIDLCLQANFDYSSGGLVKVQSLNICLCRKFKILRKLSGSYVCVTSALVFKGKSITLTGQNMLIQANTETQLNFVLTIYMHASFKITVGRCYMSLYLNVCDIQCTMK